MEKEIIYIKYDGFFHVGEDMEIYLEKLIKTFSDYPWGGGFSATNFRCDGDTYFYCDMLSEFFLPDSHAYQQTVAYIQGILSGYLMAQGIRII